MCNIYSGKPLFPIRVSALGTGGEFRGRPLCCLCWGSLLKSQGAALEGRWCHEQTVPSLGNLESRVWGRLKVQARVSLWARSRAGDREGLKGRCEQGPHSVCRLRAAVCVCQQGWWKGWVWPGFETQHLTGGTERGNPLSALSQVLAGTERHFHWSIFISSFIQRGTEPSALCGVLSLWLRAVWLLQFYYKKGEWFFYCCSLVSCTDCRYVTIDSTLFHCAVRTQLYSLPPTKGRVLRHQPGFPNTAMSCVSLLMPVL